MLRNMTAYSLIFLLSLPLGMSGCATTQQNLRKTSLGVLEAIGTIQDVEMEGYKLGVISRSSHQAFNARLEQLLILGRDFNRTAWLYPATTVGLDQARALTASLAKLSADVMSMIPAGKVRDDLLRYIQVAQGVLTTALVIILEER